MELANEPRFASTPPARIVPALADEGVYVASEASFHRVLRDHGQMRRRGRARPPRTVGPPSTHVATAPGQVWCWDVTFLPAHVQGRWFYLFLILDLFSRKIVGYEVHNTDQAEHAAHLVRRTALAEGIHAQALRPVLHGDNGPSVKGTTVLAMLHWLGIAPSHSARGSAMTMPMPRRCSAPPSTAPTFPPRALPTSPRRGSGRPPSCTGTTTSTATVASATSPRPSAMPVGTAPSSPPATPCTSRRARPIHAAGAGRPATGRRSAPSPSTPSATASWPASPNPCSLVRLADLLSRPDLVAPRPRRAAAVMDGAQPPAATRSAASMARLASTDPSPPRAPRQPHPPSGGLARSAQDRKSRYEISAATGLTCTAAKSLFTFGHRTGLLHADVARPLHLPKVKNVLAERILEEAEVARLIVLEPSRRNHALLRLLYLAGLRLSEAAG